MTLGAIGLSNQLFSEQQLDILLSDVACDGSETDLLDCATDSRQTFCGPRDDAGAVCQGSHCDRVLQVVMCFICADVSTLFGNCTHGQLRLYGGVKDPNNRTWSGRLEICLNDAWGTICNTSFGDVDAKLACDQLSGYHREGTISLTSKMHLIVLKEHSLHVHL